jgi:predicted N-acetyltransferase YhbS
MLDYSVTAKVSVEQFRDVLLRSGLAERRPISDEATMQQMLAGANIIATCWKDSLLVGIARSVTDFSYCCYLSDLAVDSEYQHQGIGRQLIELTEQQLGPHGKIILLAAPAAKTYYAKVGFEHHPEAWIRRKLQG